MLYDVLFACCACTYRGLVEVWTQLLDKTADLAKQRQTVADLLIDQVSEMMEQQQRVKETAYKKVSQQIAYIAS